MTRTTHREKRASSAGAREDYGPGPARDRTFRPAGAVLAAIVAMVISGVAPGTSPGAIPDASSAAPLRAVRSSGVRRAAQIGIANGRGSHHSESIQEPVIAGERSVNDGAGRGATPGNRLVRWRFLIAEASERFGVPAEWIGRVMMAESAGLTHRHGAPIRSRKGAIGLMQLMPGTWREIRAKLDLGNDPDQPRDNILAGTYYLRILYDRFGYPGLFAAYNAGPARYERYLAGMSLPAETRAYLARTTSTDRGETGAGRGVAAAMSGWSGPVTGGSLFAVRQAVAVSTPDMRVRGGPGIGAEPSGDLAGPGAAGGTRDETFDAGAAGSLLRHSSSADTSERVLVARATGSTRETGEPRGTGGAPGRGSQGEGDRTSTPAPGHMDAVIFAVRRAAQ